jgi:hypothetical protein
MQISMANTDKAPPPAYIYCLVEMPPLRPSPPLLVSASALPSPGWTTLSDKYPNGIGYPDIDPAVLKARLRDLRKRCTCPVRRILFKAMAAADRAARAGDAAACKK